MTRGRLRRVVALFVALLGIASLAVVPAAAQDAAPVPVPAPAPPAAPVPAPAPRTPDKAPPAAGLTQTQLEAQLSEHRAAFVTMLVLKWGAAVAGVVILILGLVRRRDERAGLVAPARASAAPPAPFAPLVAVGVLILMMGAQWALSRRVARVPGAIEDGKLTWPWGFGITAATTIVVAVVVARTLARARRREGRTAWPPGPSLALGGRGWLVATALAIPATLLWVLLLSALGHPPVVQDLIAKAASPDASRAFLLALGVFGCLVAPVTEELLFRGALFGSLRAHVGSRPAALLSSLLFAAVHESAMAFVPLLVLALVLCWVYERSGSLVAPIVVHVLNNATSLLPLFLVHV